MKMTQADLTIRDVLELTRNKMLTVNAEYQRGLVWTKTQRKKLIDSVMRGYPLPLIYLHHMQKVVASMQREDLEIIDGQQRINALFEFSEGAWPLFDPVADDKEAKFPRFIKAQPCPWGGKDYASLSDDLKEQFLDTVLAAVKIETDDDNEVRDLFVRLQSGQPLNAQETRDAWPGQFTDFILKLGGKPDIVRYPGHEFFQRVMGMRPGTDRGKTRQFAAQIAMLFLQRRANGADSFTDINSGAIHDFYYANVDFDSQSPEARRLVSILDKLLSLLGAGKHPKLRAHDAIHLVLLTDTLMDGYTPSWEDSLPEALDQFLGDLATATKAKDDAQPDEYWLRYGQWTRVNSDRADRIALRHEFYAEKMFGFLGQLTPKDPNRLFGPLEREIIYFRDKKRCAVCKGTVAWAESEIHHVEEHQHGGRTSLENGVLVHGACHPKGAAAIAFAKDFAQRRAGETELAAGR
jgi:hypothetical protein